MLADMAHISGLVAAEVSITVSEEAVSAFSWVSIIQYCIMLLAFYSGASHSI